MTEPTRPNAGWQSENIVYGNIITGEAIVGTTSAILGTAQASLVMLKAAAGNAGTVYIGASGVTIVGTVNNTTAGWQLTAGESTAWLPISNVSNLWGIASAASQVVFFVALS